LFVTFDVKKLWDFEIEGVVKLCTFVTFVLRVVDAFIVLGKLELFSDLKVEVSGPKFVLSRVENKFWFDDCCVVWSVFRLSVTDDVNETVWLIDVIPVVINLVDNWFFVLNVILV